MEIFKNFYRCVRGVLLLLGSLFVPHMLINGAGVFKSVDFKKVDVEFMRVFALPDEDAFGEIDDWCGLTVKQKVYDQEGRQEVVQVEGGLEDRWMSVLEGEWDKEAGLWENNQEGLDGSLRSVNEEEVFLSSMSIRQQLPLIQKEEDKQDKGESREKQNKSKRFNTNLVKMVDREKRSFVCDECGRAFTTQGGLTRHTDVHMEKKLFRCDQCDFIFKTLGDFTDHEKFHTGEKKFQCDECGKAFITLSGVTRHKVFHTEERPFKCEVKNCGKSFIAQGYLNKHQKVHTNNNKLFNCNECGKKLKFKSYLKRHQESHAKKRSFFCNVMDCGKAFKSKRSLIAHKKNHICHRP